MSEKLPIVYDRNCPPDYEHEIYGVLFVGLKSKQTHVVTEIVQDDDSRRILSIKTAEIAKANKPLTPSEFPSVLGVPKPTYAWVGPPKSNAQINYEMREKGMANKARGILKHGPYGSGEAGPCDADCAKCAHEKLGAMKRAAEPLPVVFDRDCPRDYEDEAFGVRWVGVKKKATHEIVRIVGDEHGRPTKVETRPIDREAASAAWSAQLRVKVAEQKERDAEAARYTPWWSPEEQQGGDL